VTASTRDDALDAAVAAWDTDLLAGHEAVLLAWRRREVANLNQRARQRRLAAGAVTGPEVEAPGGKRYAAGDRIVTLAPSSDGRYVTSERGTVTAVADDRLTVRFDDGRLEMLAGEELGPDRLDHAYAVTVHRTQGATVDRAHVFADGGGRELPYVAMSRARDTTHVYVAADDVDQAAEDLTAEWSVHRRQRWTLDVDQPVAPGERGTPVSLDGRPRSYASLSYAPNATPSPPSPQTQPVASKPSTSAFASTPSRGHPVRAAVDSASPEEPTFGTRIR
jgi:hypothetical protein